MIEHILYCKDCGNTDTFEMPAVEYHTWLVDNQGDFLQDMDTLDGDCGPVDNPDFTCHTCKGMNVISKAVEEEIEECCPHCGREEEGHWYKPCPSDDCPSNNIEEPPSAEELEKEYGHWKEHPDWPAMDWRQEVSDDNTRQGYWSWVHQRLLDEYLEKTGRNK